MSTSKLSLPTVRRANPGDSQGILRCLHDAFEPYRSRYTPEAFLDTTLTAETLQHRLATMSVYVALKDRSKIVGTIGCQITNPKIGYSNEGHLRGMAVLPACQASGVAAQLLIAAESELRDKGCSRITLDTTEPLQPAMRFYEKHGYRRSGRVTDFFGMPLIEYIKTLTPH
jgi:GNAT superfamily N-acetyltransferase